MGERQIFILDDDPGTRSSLTAVLGDAGYKEEEIEASGDWTQISALVMATNRRDVRAVLIADLNMPGIRGEDFCKTVMAYCKNVKIVLHSADPDLVDRARQLGETVTAIPKGLGAVPILTAVALAFA